MCTPSRTTSGSVSRFVPCGQMTCTSHPASCNARLSCHTRRSNGTERFSTRMSALPAKAHVPIGCPARFGVGKADEVDDDPVARRIQRGEDRWVLAADDADLGVREDVVDRVAEQVAQVRQPAFDVVPVRAHEPPNANPGRRYAGLTFSLRSARNTSITLCESTPSAWQIAPSSLAKAIFKPWKELSAYLVISATAIGTRNTSPGSPSYIAATW